MNAVMYHYVRSQTRNMPHFRYLHIDNFKKQLDYFQNVGHLISREEFLEAVATKKEIPDGFLLTFDDGFKDHIDYVLPELLSRNAVGLFFIPTAPYQSGRLLDVHRVHHLLGHFGGSEMLSFLLEHYKSGSLPFENIPEFHTETYSNQENDQATVQFKRVLNYFADPAQQTEILNILMGSLLSEDELFAGLYLTLGDLAEMHQAGMVIGSHSQNHRVLSKLSPQEQLTDLTNSLQFLDNILDVIPVKTFCYPYGGFHSFNEFTEATLMRLGCQLAFNVEPRMISSKDFIERPSALPRYDCNMFPFGTASMG
ncbi:polysaccharide deacetylase family protein [Halodesulfovibrio aestuarii]|uniref:Polysaccharide deacetylase family protein n=1 Tax=Halodesulfovibrio aestuarii TaxID=126333 RepID=A0ABV4JZ53_9BACT